MADSFLSHARYGKDKVRVLRVVREGEWHHVVEYNVCVLLEGDIETSYTQADNSVVVATDSMKNITYHLAKISPHVLVPERFALHLGVYLVSKYPHIHKAFVTIERLRWTRIPVSGKEEGKEGGHAHSFYRDGNDKVLVNVEVDATNGKDKLIGKVEAGISDLLVLKSTNSSFENFIKDEHTTLIPVTDRIFSTSIDLKYTFPPIPLPTPSDSNKFEFTLPSNEESSESIRVLDPNTIDRVRQTTLKIFSEDKSASVQATLYKTAQTIIRENPSIRDVTIKLPNKHYIPVDMRYVGIDNTTPDKAEVFLPIDAPSGLITATVTRK